LGQWGILEILGGSRGHEPAWFVGLRCNGRTYEGCTGRGKGALGEKHGVLVPCEHWEAVGYTGRMGGGTHTGEHRGPWRTLESLGSIVAGEHWGHWSVLRALGQLGGGGGTVPHALSSHGCPLPAKAQESPTRGSNGAWRRSPTPPSASPVTSSTMVWPTPPQLPLLL